MSRLRARGCYGLSAPFFSYGSGILLGTLVKFGRLISRQLDESYAVPTLIFPCRLPDYIEGDVVGIVVVGLPLLAFTI